MGKELDTLPMTDSQVVSAFADASAEASPEPMKSPGLNSVERREQYQCAKPPVASPDSTPVAPSVAPPPSTSKDVPAAPAGKAVLGPCVVSFKTIMVRSCWGLRIYFPYFPTGLCL